MLKDYFFRRTGFSRQLTITVSAAILSLALFSSLLMSWEASRRMRDNLVGQGLQITENLARQSTLALLYYSADNVHEGVATTLAFPDVLQVEITDANNRILLSQTKTGGTKPMNMKRPFTDTLTHARLGQETDDEWRFDAPVYGNQAEPSPFELKERQPQLLGYVHVILGKATLKHLVISLLIGNLLITLSLSFILLSLLRFLAGHLIRPLNALSDLMRRAEAGESGIRVTPEGPRDLINMANAFNKMMTVLEEREAELQRSRDQAVHTAQMKTQFAATVSHEVRTPLNGVVGMLELLKEMHLTKPQRECVEVAWNSSHALIELINGILDFSKMEAGKLELEAIDFDLRELVEGVLDLLSRQAQQKGLQLGYLLAANVPSRIKSDPLRLRQVLINLVNNALKFTEQGEVAVHISGGDFSLSVEVRDTGIGMDEEAARHVFESFTQADPSTTRKYGGTGLGLTICKQLVELLGGEIGLTSRLGQGSTFWFTIPCQPGEVRPPSPPVQALQGARAGLSGKTPRNTAAVSPALLSELPAVALEYRVLVVEDNRTNQMVVAGMLAMSGCHCECASSGREALEAVGQSRFDLIFMDCNMPDMDGYETTVRIRHIEKALKQRTPIVALTANVQSGDVEKCHAAGMDDYLAKPITLIELRHMLEHWLPSSTVPGLTPPPVVQPPAATDGPLNMALFEKLREVLGPALQHAVTPYLEDMPIYLGQLEQAVKQGDPTSVVTIAHAIRGSSSNLGATRLALLAKEMEELALHGQMGSVSSLLPRLQHAFDAVAAVLGTEVHVEDCFKSRQEKEAAQVLVVDDDRSTRSTIRYALQREGFRVEEAENGAQALLLLKRMQPDIILMDAVMPVMDGFTACAKVQELPHDRAIPVLMITSLEDNKSVERAFAVGASDYIAKPIHCAVLAKRVRRIIEANRAEKRIRHLAYNDVLTGLPNRALFFDQLGWRIEQAQKAGDSVAVLFLDLDRFKYVNDNLGHDVGDRLLVAVAQRIRRSVRSVDCVARLGGDEFTVVLADLTGPAAAATAAQNICRALVIPFQIDGHEIFISTSVGISLYPNDGSDTGTLLKHADTAMYRAKKTSAGFQFFEPSMAYSISEHVRLENDLRQALERQELELVYQPQAGLDSGQIIGMEALLRWRHPTRGLVMPDVFIPLAEETGLINAIGAWVLHTACAQLQAWIISGLPILRMAVNLSARQLLQKDFAATVEQVLTDTGLPPHLLELEITESTLMEHAEDTLLALHRLHSLGVRLTIDDFGTGYSSLAYLKRFPVDIIKIDRSFVRDLPHDMDDAAIVTSIIALAHSLRLEVVAEGVETEAQLRFLREQSCDLIQGYYLSKPVSAEQLACFILQHVNLPMES